MAQRRAAIPRHPAASRRRAPARGLAALCAAACLTGAAPAAAGETAALASAAAPESAGFEPVLAQLGEWVRVRRWGRAWRPSAVEENWRPYFHGSWTYTEDGWFWVTDEPWGFATYHYGRWLFDGTYGWVWLPGRTWAPAWVAWRWDAEVVGWAPLPPAGAPAIPFWTFVPAGRFVGERAEAAALPEARVPALWARTRPAAAHAPAAAAERAMRPARGERRG